MKRLPPLLLPALFFLPLVSLHAAETKGAGSSSFPFLKIPISARAAAMGGSLGATADDVAIIETNPGGLSGVDRTDIQATYINYLEDTSLQSLLVGFPIQIGPNPRVEPLEGVEFPQNKLNLAFQYKLFKANDTARNDQGLKLSDFDVRDQLLAISIAYPIFPRLSIGLTGKSISSRVDNKSVNNSAIDCGGVLRINSRWSTGLALQNFGSAKKYDGTLASAEYPLPTTLRSHVGYRQGNWLLVADLSHAADSVTRESGGFEWNLNRFVRLRGGLYHATTLEFTGGLGVQLAGPLKYTKPNYRPPNNSNLNTTSAPSPMSKQIIARMTSKLVETYKPTKIDTELPSLSVIHFTSQESAADTIHTLFQKEFVRSDEFKVLTNGDPATFIVSGNVDRSDDRYVISARLIRMEDGETIATDKSEIAVEDFYEKKKALDDAAPEHMDVNPKKEYSRVNIGLDYGISSLNDIGLIHTVTLKILY